jgi:hypothetical protein
MDGRLSCHALCTAMSNLEKVWLDACCEARPVVLLGVRDEVSFSLHFSFFCLAFSQPVRHE